MSCEERLHVLLASIYADSMAKQLENAGYTDYSYFLEECHRYYETDEIIVNPYEITKTVATEEEWMNSDRLASARKAVNEEVELLYRQRHLFSYIEVETINRCNGLCSFCPVNWFVLMESYLCAVMMLSEDIR